MRELGIGLLGLGEVGAGVVRILRDREDELTRRLGVRLAFRRACVRDADKDRKVEVGAERLTTSNAAVIDAPDVDFVVELIGGLEPAYAWTLRALEAGKHVVTANKALLAERGDEIFAAARRHGVDVRYEGAVGGGIPIIRTLREALASDRISRLAGIINGTSNYVLTRMEEDGVSFGEALADAQARGFAEADPTLDVGGLDAAHKLALMVSLAFGTRDCLRSIHVEGIERVTPQDMRFARELGYRVKPLCLARDLGDAVEARVHPTLVPAGSMLGSVSGVFNAVYLEGGMLGPVLLWGRGAGGGPTGVSVVADLVDLARDVASGARPRVAARAMPEGALGQRRFLSIGEVETPAYLRFTVVDRPGVLAGITAALGSRGVSIAAILQRGEAPGGTVPVVLQTYRARQGAVQEAIADIEGMDFVRAPTVLLRIEPQI
jgi:homoserine dehydrogenase